MIYHIDKECGTDLGKKYTEHVSKGKGLSVSRYCQWLGITRQAYYQAEKRAQMTAQATEQILELVMEYRCLMPSIGTRKLYWLIKGKLLQRGLKCGRDQLFKY